MNCGTELVQRVPWEPEYRYVRQPIVINVLKQGLANFSIKSQSVNILSSVGHIVSVTTTHLCLCGAKAATGNTYRDEHRCVPVKLYWQKQTACGIWLMSYRLLRSALKDIQVVWNNSPSLKSGKKYRPYYLTGKPTEPIQT